MTPVALVLVLIAAAAMIGWMFNHALARLAFIELAITSGVPTMATMGTMSTSAVDAGNGTTTTVFQPALAVEALDGDGIFVFASPSCLTCTMLIDELAAPDVHIDPTITVHYSGAKGMVDAPGPVLEHQQDLFDRIGVPATPYVVIIRSGEVAAHAAVANPRRFQSLLVAAELPDRLPVRLLAHAEGAPS